MQVFLTVVSAITFIVYGLLCLFTNHMQIEFEHYRLSQYRKLTGSLELLGGIGLLVGQYYSPLIILCSSGLSVLMFLGVIFRLKARDPLFEILPALLLMVLNLQILFSTFSS